MDDLTRKLFAFRKGQQVIFTIDSDDNITAHGTNEPNGLKLGTKRFASEADLTQLTVGWPGARLVEIWNRLPGVQPVRKFTNRTIAVRRIWSSLQSLDGGSVQMAPKHGSAPARAARKSRPAKTSARVAPGTKTEQVIALLRQPGGATVEAIMRLTQWQAHSIRGFISGQVSKKMGLKVKSFRREGRRVYAIRH